jgi:hypothetical protein
VQMLLNIVAMNLNKVKHVLPSPSLANAATDTKS